jgi:hypothetical protein
MMERIPGPSREDSLVPYSWLLLRKEEQVIYVYPALVQQHFLRYPSRVIFARHPQPIDALPEPIYRWPI